MNGSSPVLGKEERGSELLGNGVSSGSGGTEGEGEGPLPSLAARVSLTDEVFSNLPEDLQKLLLSSSSSCKCGYVWESCGGVRMRPVDGAASEMVLAGLWVVGGCIGVLR